MTWCLWSFLLRIASDLLIFTCVLLSALLFYVFYEKGGKIQKIVLDKRGTRFIRSAFIDFFYAFILLYFKQYNDIASTTWVFVGLLCGRELAIASMVEDYKLKYVFLQLLVKTF